MELIQLLQLFCRCGLRYQDFLWVHDASTSRLTTWNVLRVRNSSTGDQRSTQEYRLLHSLTLQIAIELLHLRRLRSPATFIDFLNGFELNAKTLLVSGPTYDVYFQFKEGAIRQRDL